MTRKKINVPDGCKLIFRRFRKDPRTGKQLNASHYGLKAWPIVVCGDKEIPHERA